MKIFSFALPLAVGGLAAWLTMGSMSQYAALVQPPFAPPAWIFPIAWTILYVLMGWASLRVRQSGSPERSNALALYYTQLAVNFVWPLLFFSRWTVRNGVLVADSAAGACTCHRKGVLPY